MERKREMEREERWKRDKWRAREREAWRQIDRPTEGHRERERHTGKHVRETEGKRDGVSCRGNCGQKN